MFAFTSMPLLHQRQGAGVVRLGGHVVLGLNGAQRLRDRAEC